MFFIKKGFLVRELITYLKILTKNEKNTEIIKEKPTLFYKKTINTNFIT